MSVPDSHINVTDKDSTQTIGPTNTHLSSLPTPSLTMLANSKRIKTDSDSFWNIWNENSSNKKKNEKKKKKHFPVSKFLHNNPKKAEEIVLGPGGGVGIGCGVGLGFGLVGGVGYGGWPWNHLQLVIGVGIGCGVGVGFGYGQGIGYGFSLVSLESYLSKQSSSDSKKRVVIEI